ncbi:hypothetical protein M3Y94_00453500 [Aphelenchoides besseyi]|nr:hypothetical protein M3Y94_00453500 [Aphelenchoides besseyi]
MPFLHRRTHQQSSSISTVITTRQLQIVLHNSIRTTKTTSVVESQFNRNNICKAPSSKNRSRPSHSPKKAARKRPSKKGANSENLNPVAISTASNAAPGQILICTGGNASQPMVIQYATPGENIYTTGPSGSQQIVLQYQPVPLSTADGNELIVEAPPRLPTPLILPSPQELAQRIEAKRETRRNKLAVFFRLLRERLDKTDFITPYESRADAINRLLPFALHDEPDFSPEYMEKVDYELYRHSVYMEDKVRNIEGRLRKIFYDDAMGKREHDYELNMLYYLDAEYEQRRLKTDQVDAKNDNDSFLRESEIIRSGVDYADLKERETKIPTRPDNFNDISQSQFEYHDFDERIYEREIPRTPSPPRSKPRRGKKKREKQRYLYASDLDDSEEDEDDEMDDEKTEESSDENESDFETAEREKREAQLAQLNAATLKISSIEVMCSVEKDSNNVDDLIVEIKRETELISSLLKDGELTPRTSANASSTLILANDLIARLRRLQTEAMEKRANQQLQSTIVKEIPIGDVKSKRHHDEKIKSSLPQDLENVMPSVFLNPMIPNTDIGNVPPIAALNQWASQHVQPLVDTVESRTKTSPIENVTLPRPFTPEDDRPSAQNFARLSRKNSPPLLINLVQELSRERPEPTASTRVMVAPPELLFGKASQSSTIPADDMPRLQPISPTTTNVSQRLAGMPPNVLNAAIGQAKSELLNARIAEVQKSQQTIPPPKLSPDAWKGLQLKSSATTMVQARNEMHKPPHLQPSTMPEKSTSRLLEPPAAFDDPRLLNISANQTETHLLPPTNVDRPPSTSRPFTLKQRLLNKTPINIHQSAQMPPPTQSNMLRHDTHHSTGGSSPKKRRTSGVSSPSKSQINLSSSQSSLSTESKPSLKLTFRKSDNGVNSISASQKSTATHSTASQKTGGLTLKLPLKASKVSDPLALKFEPTPSSSSTKTAEEKAERKRLKKEKKREKEKAREKEKKHEKEKKREKEPREKREVREA